MSRRQKTDQVIRNSLKQDSARSADDRHAGNDHNQDGGNGDQRPML
jgi:hypothetical protein